MSFSEADPRAYLCQAFDRLHTNLLHANHWLRNIGDGEAIEAFRVAEKNLLKGMLSVRRQIDVPYTWPERKEDAIAKPD